MGNLQIMPMMYFQLNNVPLWKGGYQIIKVNHNITAGNIDTVFEGMRINRYAIPFGGDFVLTIKNDGSENGGSSTNDTSKTSNGGNTGGGNNSSSGGGSNIPDTFPRPDATLPYSSSVDFDASSISKVSPVICITPSHGPKTQKKEEWDWSTKLVLKMIEIFKSEPSKYKFKNGKPYYKNVQRCNKDGQNTGKGYSMRETKSIINKYGSDKVVSLAPHWNGGGGNYYATYIAPKGQVREDSLKFANAMKAVVDEYLDGPLKEIFVDEKMARPRTNSYANQIINIEEKKGGDGAPRVNCACILTENWFADWNKGKGKKLLYDHIDVIARLNCDGIKRYLDQLG